MSSSSTLTQIRQFTARHLGNFYAGTADATSTQSVLYDLTWPVKTTLAVDEQWQDAWLFRPSASFAGDKVRIVKLYTPTAGSLTPDLGWTNAPANHEPYELHTVIEPLTAFTNLINEALKRCMVEVEVTATPITGSTEHQLSTLMPWLEDRSWLRQVGYLATTEDRNKVDPFTRVVRGEMREDHKTVVINHYGQSFQSADVLYLKCMKPAYYDCAPASGAYGQQSGLSAETDITPVAVGWAGWAAVVEAWESYSHVLETSARARLAPDRAEAAARFTNQNRLNCRWPMLTFRPLLQGGPRQGRTLAAYRASTAG